jgi:hypothetical protein
MHDETHEDLLMELVTMPHWRALKRETDEIQQGLLHRLMQPMTDLGDLVAKEGYSSRLAAMRDVFQHIERKAEDRAKQVRESTRD